ncbi:hypothetical protein [Pseudoduganella violaceinigra]|uniref:hypothetical protein n=1 Tax=Pseudoduganella violaceinigra TaxID=246602 RepID=UPI000418095B|nr:hypothetical protein [Pseudoduganella violaceinigra]
MSQAPNQPPEENSSIDKIALGKQLAGDVARGAGAGILRTVLAVLAAIVVNALGVALLFRSELGGGHGSAMIYAAFVAAPFIIGTGLTGMLAYKLGLQGILARVVESQSGLIAKLGTGILETFLRSVKYEPGSPLAEKFLGQWRSFLDLQSGLPKPLPSLLASLTSRIPLAETITEVATTGMTLREVAHAAMTRTISEAANGSLRPSSQSLLIALAIQFGMWFPLGLLVRRLFG